MISALPTEKERHALIDALGELVEQQGYEPLAIWPVLLATPLYFPDPWSPDLTGATVMLTRLMRYAGLEALHVVLEPFDAEDDVVEAGAFGNSFHRKGAVAWFRGIENGSAFFGVEISSLEDPDHLAGVLAHEVAHAYRTQHGLRVDDNKLEEQLTDVTTVFLGFGVLTTNGTDRFRSWGHLEGHKIYHQWQHDQTGYLSPATMAFLLATQTVSRNGSSAEQKAIKRALEPNQEAFYASALRWLAKHEALVKERLKVPAGIKPVPFDSSLHSVVEPRPTAEFQMPNSLAELLDSSTEALPNLGQPVFRVRPHGVAIVWRVFAGAMVGLLVGSMVNFPWLVLAVPLAWVALEKWVLNPFCTACERRVGPTESQCRTCGGTVAGDVQRLRDIHDAEEEYWRKRGVRPDWLDAKYENAEDGLG